MTDGPPPDEPHIPSNLEVEQGILGAILFDNAAHDRLPEFLKHYHFHEPIHSRLFEVMDEMIRKGLLAEPVILMEKFRRDPAFEEMGGLRYLADLVDYAPPASHMRDYGQIVYDLAIRRDLLRFSVDVAAAANTDSVSSAMEIISAAEADLFSMVDDGGENGMRHISDVLGETLDVAAAAFDREGEMAGISTGLGDVDTKLGGLHPSDLLILGGRPGSGKTALAVNVARNVSRAYQATILETGERQRTAGGVVAFFSLEMSRQQVGLRLLADVSGVPGERIRNGDISFVEFSKLREAAIEIQDTPLHIDATGAITLPALVAKCRRLSRTVGLDLVIVDYLQLMRTGNNNPREGTEERTSVISQGLKALAKDLGVTVLALAQLSRDVDKREDKRPQLADLRSSGSIEQDADAVMFLYREAYYLGRETPKESDLPKFLEWEDKMEKCKNLAELIIGKQRHGPIGTVKLHFAGETTKFTDWTKPDF